MHQNGFVPVEVRNSARIDPAALAFTKHMIRFRQQGKVSARTVGDVVPQIVMVNAHDRSGRFELYGGLWRLVCANGMLVSESETVAPIIVRHTSRIVDNVVANSHAIIQQHQQVFKHVDAMRKVKLTPRQQTKFASAALELRPDRPGIIAPQALLATRREADAGSDVWSVFNRVQENLIKGGVEGHTESGRRTVTAQIKSIGPDMRINRGCWELAMQCIANAARR